MSSLPPAWHILMDRIKEPTCRQQEWMHSFTWLCIHGPTSPPRTANAKEWYPAYLINRTNLDKRQFFLAQNCLFLHLLSPHSPEYKALLGEITPLLDQLKYDAIHCQRREDSVLPDNNSEYNLWTAVRDRMQTAEAITGQQSIHLERQWRVGERIEDMHYELSAAYDELDRHTALVQAGNRTPSHPSPRSDSPISLDLDIGSPGSWLLSSATSTSTKDMNSVEYRLITPKRKRRIEEVTQSDSEGIIYLLSSSLRLLTNDNCEASPCYRRKRSRKEFQMSCSTHTSFALEDAGQSSSPEQTSDGQTSWQPAIKVTSSDSECNVLLASQDWLWY